MLSLLANVPDDEAYKSSEISSTKTVQSLQVENIIELLELFLVTTYSQVAAKFFKQEGG
jgi:hypothetical protein